MRGWTLYACPECGRYTTDTDAIDCDCGVEAWEEIPVVPDADSLGSATKRAQIAENKVGSLRIEIDYLRDQNARFREELGLPRDDG